MVAQTQKPNKMKKSLAEIALEMPELRKHGVEMGLDYILAYSFYDGSILRDVRDSNGIHLHFSVYKRVYTIGCATVSKAEFDAWNGNPCKNNDLILFFKGSEEEKMKRVYGTVYCPLTQSTSYYYKSL